MLNESVMHLHPVHLGEFLWHRYKEIELLPPRESIAMLESNLAVPDLSMREPISQVLATTASAL